jgi:hypothetical protein
MMFCTLIKSQTSTDYDIYSILINDLFNQLDPKKEFSDNAVLIDVICSDWNPVENSKYFLENSIQASMLDSVVIKKASMLIDELDIIFFNSPRTVVDSFTTVIPLQQLECADFLDYFKNNKVEKGWKRFYKKYPKAIGALAFSKVVYLDNYACLYMDFKRHGLFASGDVYILRKKDQSWEIITKINSYKA